MKNLSKDWFVEGLIDFEYKKYVLLDYLKQVNANFNKTALYPSFSEVIYHYRNLMEYVINKNEITVNFPQKLDNVDFKRMKLEYKKMIEDDTLMSELKVISDFAIDQFKITLNAGKAIYDFAESHLTIEPVGVRPIYINEGYVFTILPPGKKTNIYSYKVQLFENDNEKYRGLQLNYVETTPFTMFTTLENMKIGLTKRYQHMPNPATFVITSDMKFPYSSTFLPIAKRLLIKNVAA